VGIVSMGMNLRDVVAQWAAVIVTPLLSPLTCYINANYFAGGVPVCGHSKSWDLPVGRGGWVSSCNRYNRYVLVKSVDRCIKLITLQEGYVGIVSLGMNLRDVVARWAAFVTEISEHKYGHAPLIKVTSTAK
jgi:hypothetical protein